VKPLVASGGFLSGAAENLDWLDNFASLGAKFPLRRDFLYSGSLGVCLGLAAGCGQVDEDV